MGSFAAKSEWLNLDDLRPQHDHRPKRTYGPSKPARMYFGLELDRRPRATGSSVASVVVHPGGALDSLTPSRPPVQQARTAGAWPALHLTPSAVSQQLRLLARDLGVPLLRHEGRLVHLTPAARVLLTHTEPLYAQWERAGAEVEAVGQKEHVTGTLRLCGVSSAIAALAAPAMSLLRERCPRLTTRVREEESRDCYRRLLADEADLALFLPTPESPPVTDARFEQHPLLDDTQDLLVPQGHPLARPEGVELSQAATESWIVKQQENDTWALLSVACAAAGFAPLITHQVKEWFAVSALVSEGFGVCLLPRIVPVPAEHTVVRVPLHGQPAPSRKCVVATRRGSTGHPAIAAGLAALYAIAGGTADATEPEPDGNSPRTV